MVESAPRYRKIGTFLREAFGEKVYRVGLWNGFTCPNRDGTVGTGGCIYCNPASSRPLGYLPGTSVRDQLAEGTEYIRRRHGSRKFIAFFSDYTTTHAGTELLAALYEEALSFPGVVGLAVSTRPDCLPSATLDLLQSVASRTFLWVELGVQSAHDATLRRLNRCHDVQATRRSIAALRGRDIAVSAHVILGLPDETDAQILETATFLDETGVHGVKIHNLHVVAGTPLAAAYGRGDYAPLGLARYVELATRFLERLPSRIVVQRLSGEAPRSLTVAPAWSVNKLAVVNAVQRELERRDTWQGRGLGEDPDALLAPAEVPGTAAGRRL